ncbi:uncharacterized protein LOC113468056 [Diaphorina citri]|uniref:Uncharacterized protein LOC113468056 n=1 Tax=Diaphorina citri TaxID=121845 RepID=A0A3Q0IW61_DIACI|nr:uncharacterized protein LOC113468056 [Diaphorina citri]
MVVPMISKRSEENESEPKTSANMCSIFIEEERKNCFANENTEALEESDDHVVTKTDANDEKELSRQSDNHILYQFVTKRKKSSTEERNIMDVPMISKRSEENESEPKTNANMCSIFIEEERKNCFANENTEALEESDDHVVTKTDANDEKELSRQSNNHKLKYAEPVQEDDVNNSNEPCESIQDVGSNQLTENKIVNKRSAVETSNVLLLCSDIQNSVHSTNENEAQSSQTPISNDDCENSYSSNVWEDKRLMIRDELYSKSNETGYISEIDDPSNVLGNHHAPAYSSDGGFQAGTTNKGAESIIRFERKSNAELIVQTDLLNSIEKNENTLIDQHNFVEGCNKHKSNKFHQHDFNVYRNEKVEKESRLKIPQRKICLDVIDQESHSFCQLSGSSKITTAVNVYDYICVNLDKEREQLGYDMNYAHECNTKSPTPQPVARNYVTTVYTYNQVFEQNNVLMKYKPQSRTLFNNEIKQKSWKPSSPSNSKIYNSSQINETPLVIVDSSNEDIHIESDTLLNKNCSGSDVTWEKEMSTNNTEPPPTLLPFWNEVKDNKHNVKSIPVLKPEQKSELEENKHMNNAILNCESSLKKKRSAEEKTVEITQMKKCVLHKEEATEILPSEILKSSKLVKKRSSKPNTSIQSKVNNASEEKSCSSTEGDGIHMNNSCVNNEGRDASHTIPGIKSGLRKRSFPKTNSFDPNQQKNRENELESNDGIMYSDCKENMLITPTHSAESISDTSSSMKKSNDTHNHETLEKIEACTNNVRKCLKRIKNKRKLLKSFDEDENMNKIMKIEETTISETNLISKTFTNNKEEHVTEKCENKSVTKAKRKYYENNNTDQMKNNKIPSKLPITKTTKMNCHSHEDNLSRKKEVENEYEKSKAAEISGENGQITSRHKVSNSKVILHKKLSAINTQISVSKVGCDEKIGANKKSLKCISSLKRKLNAFDANFSLFKAEDKDLKSIKRITKKTDRNNTSFPKIVEEKTSSAEISFLQEKNDFTNNEVTGNTVEEQVPVVNKTILEESDEEKLLEEMVSATLKPLDTLCTVKDVEEEEEEKYDSSENAFKSLDTRCINKVVRKVVKNHQSSKEYKSNNNNLTLREKGNTTDGHENGKLLQQTVSEEITARQQDTSKDTSDKSYALVNETVSLVPSISPNNGNNDKIYMESPVSKKIRDSLDTKLSVCSDVEIFP